MSDRIAALDWGVEVELERERKWVILSSSERIRLGEGSKMGKMAWRIGFTSVVMGRRSRRVGMVEIAVIAGGGLFVVDSSTSTSSSPSVDAWGRVADG